jgi:hypothetical protein
MCAPQPNRQMKPVAMWPGRLQARLLETQAPLLEANFQVIRLVLLRAHSRVKVMSLAQHRAKPRLLALQSLPQD